MPDVDAQKAVAYASGLSPQQLLQGLEELSSYISGTLDAVAPDLRRAGLVAYVDHSQSTTRGRSIDWVEDNIPGELVLVTEETATGGAEILFVEYWFSPDLWQQLASMRAMKALFEIRMTERQRRAQE